jgi:Fic family protein
MWVMSTHINSLLSRKGVKMNRDKPFNNLKELPPNSNIETIDILKQVNKSNKALAELKAYSELIPNKEILISSLVLQEAKASSEIENIVTTNDSLYKAIVTDEKYIDPSTKEVLNYRKALWKGVELIEKGILTTNNIIMIQQVLENNNAGIRKVPGTSLKNAITGEVIYTPPTGEEVLRNLLSNLEKYINTQDDIDPLIKMAVSHYQFEAIHPFYDGNGRTGRIINILYLMMTDLLDSPILYLSSYIIKNKNDYYRLLNEVTLNEKWEEWILFILKAVEITSKKTLELAKNIKSLIDITATEVKEKNSKIYSYELIEIIFREVYTKTNVLVEKNIASRKTATKYLKSLEELGILSADKVGKEVIYINNQLMELLKST